MQNRTLDKIVKIAVAGIVAAGLNSCIEFRQNPNHPSQKQYRYDEGESWNNCKCNSDSDCSGYERYCNGCFCVECRSNNDCMMDEKCSNGSCEEKKDYFEREFEKEQKVK